MRYVFGFLMALAVLAFAACGGNGGECAEPVDVAGEWQVSATSMENTCDGIPGFRYTFGLTIMQEENELTAQAPSRTFLGTICGDRIQMSASYAEFGGTTTSTMVLNVSADENSVEGSDNWTWTNGVQSCRGSDSLRGTRISSCSPFCAVGEECLALDFDQCMATCVDQLSQAVAVSSQCADAVRSRNICVGGLTCVEFDAWFDAWLRDDPPDAYPCKSQSDGYRAACFE